MLDKRKKGLSWFCSPPPCLAFWSKRKLSYTWSVHIEKKPTLLRIFHPYFCCPISLLAKSQEFQEMEKALVQRQRLL